LKKKLDQYLQQTPIAIPNLQSEAKAIADKVFGEMNGTTPNPSSPSGQSTSVPLPEINGSTGRNNTAPVKVGSVSDSPLLARRQAMGSSDLESNPKVLPIRSGNADDPLNKNGRRREINPENEPLF